MKKLITSLLLLVTVTAYSQTTKITSQHFNANGDTVLVTTTTQIVTTVTVDSVVKKYVKPAPPVVVVTNPGGPASRPVTYSNKSNFSINNLSFSGGTSDFITLSNCSNVHITLCRFSGADVWAINLQNCTNITIDNCFFTMVCKGVMAKGGSGIKVNNNQFLNLYEPGSVKADAYKGDFAHFVQFNAVTGAGNQINLNRFENIHGQAVHPHDIINCFNCSGTAASPLQVIGNWIRGGQVDGGWPGSGDTGAGITFDNGAYILCQGNIGVNPGCAWIQINTANGGTHSNVTIDSNVGVSLIASKVAADGIIAEGSKSNVTISNNHINWLKWNGAHGIYPGNETGYWNGSPTINPAITFTKNNWYDTNINASILPATIITYK